MPEPVFGAPFARLRAGASEGEHEVHACADGLTVDDHRYLDMLKREQRPIGERAVQAQLYDIDPLRITDDIEPLLIGLGLISVTSKGRQITVRGANFLRDAKQISVR